MFAQLGYYICVPFAWLTRVFYSLTGSYGLALILFTLVVKLVILPFQLKGKKSMLRMSRMQGKIKEIQTKYANNKQRQQQEMADLYAREGVNPMSGCLWSFLPFPILIALYAIIRQPLRYLMGLSVETISSISDEMKMTAMPTEIDLRGMDCVEAICVLDRYLDEAMRAKLSSVRIIHGKGTGVLRNAVQQSLKRNKFIKKFRLGQYGEGEDGVTIAEFI